MHCLCQWATEYPKWCISVMFVSMGHKIPVMFEKNCYEAEIICDLISTLFPHRLKYQLYKETFFACKIMCSNSEMLQFSWFAQLLYKNNQQFNLRIFNHASTQICHSTEYVCSILQGKGLVLKRFTVTKANNIVNYQI